MTKKVRTLATSEIFRPKANTSVSLVLSSVQGANTPAWGSQFLLLFQRWRSSSASEMDAPALGSHFLLPSNTGVTDALASGSRMMPLSLTPMFLKRQKRMRQRQGANFLLPPSTLAFGPSLTTSPFDSRQRTLERPPGTNSSLRLAHSQRLRTLLIRLLYLFIIFPEH